MFASRLSVRTPPWMVDFIFGITNIMADIKTITATKAIAPPTIPPIAPGEIVDPVEKPVLGDD